MADVVESAEIPGVWLIRPEIHTDERGRFLETREVAAMVAWLCSAENSFTTGAVFDLSGGRATY